MGKNKEIIEKTTAIFKEMMIDPLKTPNESGFKIGAYIKVEDEQLDLRVDTDFEKFKNYLIKKDDPNLIREYIKDIGDMVDKLTKETEKNQK